MSNWKQIAAHKALLSRETGTIHKDHGGRLRIALAYPNTYQVGMTSLALQILYRAFNARPDVVCERVFWEPQAAAAGWPLLTLESGTPVHEFDVWAFTVSFEMDYFHVAGLLRQAGVPALAETRRGEARWPLLIAGGPALSMNPEPLAPFFDAIVIGEAEELLPDLLQTLAEGIHEDRDGLLKALAQLPGVYLPDRMQPDPAGPRIQRLWVRDMARLEPVSCLYTPDAELPNRHLIEIARGCGRGCRFCLAGYVYRPPREQPVERILDWARAGLARQLPIHTHGGPTGHQPPVIGLVSAAVSDHSQIDELASELQAMGARISVSSMRTDPISVPLVRALAASGAATLTIAPEAGSERLRRVIGKTQTEEHILAAAELAQALNFPQLKMYFMVGHPTETEDDIQGIVELTLKVRRRFRRNIAINATPFVPKAHTPFQWQGMTRAAILAKRQQMLKKALAQHHVTVNADPPEWAEVQAILARGDRRLAPVIAEMERLTLRHFYRALVQHGLSAEELLGPRQAGRFMPWDIVDSGVTPSFFRYEGRLAEAGRPGHRCPPNMVTCMTCGVCGSKLRIAEHRLPSSVPCYLPLQSAI
ncbi:MAG: radical SAM protein [Anaerolineae bacterium]